MFKRKKQEIYNYGIKIIKIISYISVFGCSEDINHVINLNNLLEHYINNNFDGEDIDRVYNSFKKITNDDNVYTEDVYSKFKEVLENDISYFCCMQIENRRSRRF